MNRSSLLFFIFSFFCSLDSNAELKRLLLVDAESIPKTFKSFELYKMGEGAGEYILVKHKKEKQIHVLISSIQSYKQIKPDNFCKGLRKGKRLCLNEISPKDYQLVRLSAKQNDSKASVTHTLTLSAKDVENKNKMRELVQLMESIQ